MKSSICDDFAPITSDSVVVHIFAMSTPLASASHISAYVLSCLVPAVRATMSCTSYCPAGINETQGFQGSVIRFQISVVHTHTADAMNVPAVTGSVVCL